MPFHLHTHTVYVCGILPQNYKPVSSVYFLAPIDRQSDSLALTVYLCVECVQQCVCVCGLDLDSVHMAREGCK